ncbi:MAG: hypothetical protein AAB074_06515 [Planctomycetota bacterium]
MRSRPIAIALFVVASLASAEPPRSARPETGGVVCDSFTASLVNKRWNSTEEVGKAEDWNRPFQQKK